jgi:hypothetical protein
MRRHAFIEPISKPQPDERLSRMLLEIGSPKRLHAIIQAKQAFGIECDGYHTNHTCNRCGVRWNTRRYVKDCLAAFYDDCPRCGVLAQATWIDALWENDDG